MIKVIISPSILKIQGWYYTHFKGFFKPKNLQKESNDNQLILTKTKGEM